MSDRNVFHQGHCVSPDPKEGSGRGRVSLTVLPGERPKVRKSTTSKWRAGALITVHLVMMAHITHWAYRGRTLSPVEPSEAMYTLNQGHLNAGFLFFAAAILATVLLGRFVCGWGCHFVAYQDFCYWVLKKVGIKAKPLRSRILTLAPLALALYMFVWPTVYRLCIGVPAPEITNHIMKSKFWETFPGPVVAVLTVLVAGMGIVYFLGAKGFCTYACPYGGFFGLVDKVAPGRILVTDDCEHCGHCTAVCTSNVRVHEEVALYGMVKDPGCMKCMDCVSVCPNDALYFGFTNPFGTVRGESPAKGHDERGPVPQDPESRNKAGKAKEPRNASGAERVDLIQERRSPADAKKSEFSQAPPWVPSARGTAVSGKTKSLQATGRRRSVPYDFSLWEEWVMVAVGLAALLTFRGLYDQIPLLMAMAMAAISAYLAAKTARLFRDANVRLQNLQLKRGGRLTRFGKVFLGATTAFGLLAAQSAAVQYKVFRGRTSFARAEIKDEVWEPDSDWWQRATPESRSHVEAALSAYHWAERWSLIPSYTVIKDLVWIHLARNQIDAAEQTVRRLIALYPHESDPYRGLAEILRKRGRIDEAMVQYRKALDADPGHSLARFALSELLGEQDRWSDALEVAHGALLQTPPDVSWALDYADRLMKRGLFPQAQAALEDLLSVVPGTVRAYWLLGVAKFQLHDVQGGVAHLRRAVERDPDFAEANYDLGLALMRLNEVDEAIGYLQKSVRLRSDFALAHYNLAVAVFMAGRPLEAKAYIQEAIRLNPADPDARAFLEMVEQQLGKN